MRPVSFVLTENSIPLHFENAKLRQGEVLEWLKRHAWKACNRQNRFAGSNPVLSANLT